MKNYFFWLAKFLTTIFIFLFILPMIVFSATSILNKNEANNKIGFGEKYVSVIKIDGEIKNAEEISSQIVDEIYKDSVLGLVIRVNSPGGAVAPSQDLYETIKKLKSVKPIVISMGNIAASGGLYLSLAASKIYAQPGTLTGSIGVIMQVPNFAKISEKVGVDMITIKAGALKDAGNPFRVISPEEQLYLQSLADETHGAFIQAVSDGRGIPIEKVKTFADGRVVLGSQALALGLVDKLGTVYDAASAVYEILGKPLTEGKMPKIKYIENEMSKFKKALSSLDSFISRYFGTRSNLSIDYLM